MNNQQDFILDSSSHFKLKCLEWLRGFDVFCLLDSHSDVHTPQPNNYPQYDLLIGAGMAAQIASPDHSIADIDRELESKPDWLFGFFSYELKNSIEKLASSHADYLGWPEFYFFKPQHLILIHGDQVSIRSSIAPAKELFSAILNTEMQVDSETMSIEMTPKMSRNEYIEAVMRLKNHIHRGDIFEVNYCQEFYAHQSIDPFYAYRQLNVISPSPFSCFFRLHEKYLLSASPERFLKKTGDEIISQPIKGTAPRSSDEKTDANLKENLKNNPKERSENIMITDLVRNDLSKIAIPFSVKVRELCGIYSFSHVHQMISTVAAQSKTDSIDAIVRATFPMGSMTGAPKIRAMQLAEEFEISRRGLYSGAVGYITPEKDFDLSVVIRSLQYNQNQRYLSYMVGGAITALSEAEREYDECLLKAAALEKVLKS
ncbi:MAG: anthranilate synthase component I family protein [Bacteroidota bacterium]|nr:MAG: anthranilate synthase component I family protein [Bacteroidota bacterium]